ncbi:uncharacterized protein METZ01_LOCUS273221 [marine metagenome]|uniref:Uncharacterized protein n=1 Tax=marine metagenome TaxID=408172 RepID=A0A382KBH3_9ZZZZ
MQFYNNLHDLTRLRFGVDASGPLPFWQNKKGRHLDEPGDAL